MASKTPYKAITIGGRPYLQGKPVFVLETPYNLRQGDSIVQIGNYTDSGNFNVDHFVEPVTFMGTIYISQVRYMCFKIGVESVKKLELPGPVEPLYILYQPMGIDLILGYDTKEGKGIPFKPVFKLEEQKD